jgi:hypothetical protein
MFLSEIGASAGLNLLWDHFHYQSSAFQWGDVLSPVILRPEWHGTIPNNISAQVIDRAGCDLMPIDPSNEHERSRLLSYIWPDQVDRMELINNALDMAATLKPAVEKIDAINWLKTRIVNQPAHTTHVIYHTIMWQYMSPQDQAQGEALITQAGKQATSTKPLAWLRLEADNDGPGAGLYLTMWPDGRQYCLGRADFHGRWVDLVELN